MIGLATTVPTMAQDRSTEAIHRHLHDELVDALVEAATDGGPSVFRKLVTPAHILDIHDDRLNDPILALLKSDQHVSTAVSWFPLTTLTPVEKLREVISTLDRLTTPHAGDQSVRDDSTTSRDISTLQKFAFKIVSEAVKAGDTEIVEFVGDHLGKDQVSPLIIQLAGELQDDRATFLPRMVELARQAKSAEARHEAIAIAARMLRTERRAHAMRQQQKQAIAERQKQFEQRALEERKVLERPIDNKLLAYAERMFARYDKNDDGMLTPDETEKMLMNPRNADFDKNGKVSVEEYARSLQRRSR